MGVRGPASSSVRARPGRAHRGVLTRGHPDTFPAARAGSGAPAPENP
ncbi:hypothetical protein SLNWT_5837 [Streptomyces albus]|uniref:Uncharacterized protein n=1 Tax=Streptomyces albus (strain ATCC 21838 / DSM 41398 / FERM P-419 / JCM 4703 / NBRC 107858) TaxID=1081613 RepID=A0A0B5ETQ1_STRA4|nr:hypothetical protein SLNWT_5837 [Streptomyces albus]AOU80515.1 hypothetical protein SLNHY_5824 [Streptomyces albus]AYN36225.1 hypothetical protein DUI70_5730 [Streptomyces albus]